jgi:hypothetical protein
MASTDVLTTRDGGRASLRNREMNRIASPSVAPIMLIESERKPRDYLEKG